ncbi:PDZ domain-containing protein [Singulisphaera sp. GP187]|uniref:PDZ domain-containing protein n=1 Tax=Singulisphaera sp. GP187 TaxID=1882752 RepID=UPI0020B14023|nr:PDZ domain-containing protein [Singulisphaera sp. GP187]
MNIDGELIGINVAVRAGAQGIGFALPIDDVKRVAAEMLSTRRLASTWHGLVADETRNSAVRKVELVDVQPNSPAAVAGFLAGDQVIRVGELDVHTPLDIERGLLDFRAGQQASIRIRRKGQDQTVAIGLQPLPRTTAPVEAGEQVWRTLGLKTTPVTPEYVVAASPKLRGGLYVQAVSPGSPGAQAQIQKGDILVGVNVGERHWETIRPDNILFILRQPEVTQSQHLQFYIVRQNGLQRHSMSVAEVATTRHTLSR